MPERDGIQMIMDIREDYPGPKEVAMSGQPSSGYVSLTRMY